MAVNPQNINFSDDMVGFDILEVKSASDISIPAQTLGAGSGDLRTTTVTSSHGKAATCFKGKVSGISNSDLNNKWVPASVGFIDFDTHETGGNYELFIGVKQTGGGNAKVVALAYNGFGSSQSIPALTISVDVAFLDYPWA